MIDLTTPAAGAIFTMGVGGDTVTLTASILPRVRAISRIYHRHPVLVLTIHDGKETNLDMVLRTVGSIDSEDSPRITLVSIAVDKQRHGLMTMWTLLN